MINFINKHQFGVFLFFIIMAMPFLVIGFFGGGQDVGDFFNIPLYLEKSIFILLIGAVMNKVSINKRRSKNDNK